MDRRLRIATIIGTRPEAIKLAPVVLAARAQPDLYDVCVIRTGQHRELVDDVMDEFGLRADIDLDLMRPGQAPAYVMARSVEGLAAVLPRVAPDWALVQGDTTSTFAGALAAFYAGIAVGHVEAGLRTGDRRSPFPEEANRLLTTRLADLHFAPTVRARANLLREAVPAGDIVVTGNTVVDALRHTLSRPHPRDDAAPGMAAPYVLVTAHRRENHGPGLERICDALEAIVADRDIRLWVPMHPHPAVRDVLERRLGARSRILLTPPLRYARFVHALFGATFVITDSGGVQEECAALGKPVLVVRDHTERSEAVDAGVARLVGTDAAAIVAAAADLLEGGSAIRRMSRATNVFGDGCAAARVLQALQRHGCRPVERGAAMGWFSTGEASCHSTSMSRQG
jgi:UDP-N-acetylglucosamine 2-epimerase (non-hydrolysing)